MVTENNILFFFGGNCLKVLQKFLIFLLFLPFFWDEQPRIIHFYFIEKMYLKSSVLQCHHDLLPLLTNENMNENLFLKFYFDLKNLAINSD